MYHKGLKRRRNQREHRNPRKHRNGKRKVVVENMDDPLYELQGLVTLRVVIVLTTQFKEIIHEKL